MYTKSKLRSKQDPNKFEPLYAKLESIYKFRFEDAEKQRNKKANSLLPIIIINLVIAVAILFFAVKTQQEIFTGLIYVPITFIAICLILSIRK